MSTIFDQDIKRSIWEGKIAIMFTLNSNDLTSHHPPPPYVMMVPRNSYFPLVTNVVKDYFSYSTLMMSDNEMWLEYKGIPLKWHIPIGVLYDMLVNNSNNNNINQNNNNNIQQQTTTTTSTSNETNNESPYQWSISVHFQSFPEKVLLRCPNEESVLTYYKNVLKEANYIKQGDINKLNNLNINQSNELWDGLKSHDYDRFWSINKVFYPGTNSQYKHIPYRIIQNNKAPLQDLIAPLDENGNERILADLFSSTNFILNDSNNSSGSSNTLLDHIKNGSVRYLIQGIEPPLESSLVWLGELFSHPDNFLYITIINNSNSSSSSNQSPTTASLIPPPSSP